MNLTDVAASMATVIAEVPSLVRAHYPAPDRLDGSPSLILDPHASEWTITHMPDGQEWAGQIVGHLLMTHESNTPGEFARMDGLVTPIADAFSNGPDGYPPHYRLAGLDGGEVDRCFFIRSGTRFQTTYAGEPVYAIDLFFDVVFRRIPEVTQ